MFCKQDILNANHAVLTTYGFATKGGAVIVHCERRRTFEPIGEVISKEDLFVASARCGKVGVHHRVGSNHGGNRGNERDNAEKRAVPINPRGRRAHAVLESD